MGLRLPKYNKSLKHNQKICSISIEHSFDAHSRTRMEYKILLLTTQRAAKLIVSPDEVCLSIVVVLVIFLLKA